jgi:hypothetical protein
MLPRVSLSTLPRSSWRLSTAFGQSGAGAPIATPCCLVRERRANARSHPFRLMAPLAVRRLPCRSAALGPALLASGAFASNPPAPAAPQQTRSKTLHPAWSARLARQHGARARRTPRQLHQRNRVSGARHRPSMAPPIDNEATRDDHSCAAFRPHAIRAHEMPEWEAASTDGRCPRSARSTASSPFTCARCSRTIGAEAL